MSTIICSSCQAPNDDQYKFCGVCGAPIGTQTIRPSAPLLQYARPIPTALGAENLNNLVRLYVIKKYYVVWRDEWSVQMVRPKAMSQLVFLFLLMGPILGIPAAVIYAPLGTIILGASLWLVSCFVLDYLCQRDHSVFLIIGDDNSARPLK